MDAAATAATATTGRDRARMVGSLAGRWSRRSGRPGETSACTTAAPWWTRPVVGGPAVGKAGAMADPSPLTADELDRIDAYWRAANYLSVGQIYLLDNPLLREPLRLEHVKPRLLGHWG